MVSSYLLKARLGARLRLLPLHLLSLYEFYLEKFSSCSHHSAFFHFPILPLHFKYYVFRHSLLCYRFYLSWKNFEICNSYWKLGTYWVSPSFLLVHLSWCEKFHRFFLTSMTAFCVFSCKRKKFEFANNRTIYLGYLTAHIYQSD